MEEIVRVIRIDTKNSGKSINEIKSELRQLRQELNNTATGTLEFQNKLKLVVQAENNLKAINTQLKQQNQNTQKDLVNMARFGESLAKSYSAINAAIGLLGNNSEDLNKALVKVSRTIQLIQSLSGLKDLIPQIKNIGNLFAGWIDKLNPIKDTFKDIANNVKEANQLKQPSTGNQIQGGASSGSGTQVKEINQVNNAYQQQSQILPALNKQSEKLTKQLEAQRKTLLQQKQEYQDFLTYYETESKKLNRKQQYLKDYLRLLDETKRLSVPEQLSVMDKELSKLGYSAKERKMFSNIKTSSKDIEDFMKYLSEMNDQLDRTQADLVETTTELAKNKEAIEAAGGSVSKFDTMLKKAGSTLKYAFSTVGIMLLITAIIEAGKALAQFIKKQAEARKEQFLLNQEINKLTNSNASNAVSTFKELAQVYQETADKSKFLTDYSDKIKELGLNVNSINDANRIFIDQSDAYISALMARGKALATESKATEIYKNYLDSLEDERAKYEKYTDYYWESGRAKYEAKLTEFAEVEGKKTEETISKLYKLADENWQEYWALFGHPKKEQGSGSSAWLKIYQDGIEKLRDAQLSAEEKEIAEINKFYDELIEAAKKLGKDWLSLEEARIKALDDLNDKYRSEELAKIKEEADKEKAERDKANKQELDDLDNKLKNIQQAYQTSQTKLGSLTKQQTNYTQGFSTGLHLFGNEDVDNYRDEGTKGTWLNQYESKENVEANYQQAIDYNNQLLEITKARITAENELLNQKLDKVKGDAEQELTIKAQLAENEIALQNAISSNEQSNTQAYIDLQSKKQQALQSTLEVASGIMGSMATIMGEETKAGKAFAISQAIIDTYKAANSAYASMAGIPYVGPALGIAAAAAAVASGIANVKTIMQTSVSATASNSISASSVSAPNINQDPITYQRNLIGDKELDKINQPIKCYVVESEITDAQNKVRVTESNATF